ncbi:hypothetical protein AHAS_Ahas08G0048100 [Arachis hypogaea]
MDQQILLKQTIGLKQWSVSYRLNMSRIISSWKYAAYQLTAFYKKYFPKPVREARELELMQQKKGSISVAEYTSKFKELCRFSRVRRGAPESYEGWMCEKYQGGLSEYYE